MAQAQEGSMAKGAGRKVLGVLLLVVVVVGIVAGVAHALLSRGGVGLGGDAAYGADGFSKDCLDEGNVTAYACVELDGRRLTQLLGESGYSWNDAYDAFVDEEDGSSVAFGLADGSNGYLDAGEVESMPVGARREGCEVVETFEGYDDVTDAYLGMCRLPDGGDVMLSDGYVVARVSDDSRRCYIVLLIEVGDDRYVMYVEDDAGIAAGVLGEGYADVDDYWESVS
jgi:hypothetical protein